MGKMVDETSERLDLDQPAEFAALTGEKIPVRLRRIELTRASDMQESDRAELCLIVLEVEWQVYCDIIEAEWFGLHAVARGGLSATSFDAAHPVELRALLRKGVAGRVLVDWIEAEDIARSLLSMPEGMAGKTPPLGMSESWLVVEAKQRMILPDELKPVGSLKKGYRTIWADTPAPVQQAEAALSAESGESDEPAGVDKPSEAANRNMYLSELADQVLTSWNWQFRCEEDSLLAVTFRGESGEWAVLVVTDEEKQLCIVYSVYPVTVNELNRADVASWLIQENYELPVGNFEMDMADGELRFRTSLDVENSRLTAELFSGLLSANLAAMDEYFNEIAVLLGPS